MRMVRYGLYAISFVAAVLVGSLSLTHTTFALGGVGYFTGNYTCSTSATGRDCARPVPRFADDVVQGRPGVTYAMPLFANKAEYRDWVINQYNSGDRFAARFIIGTMLGSPSQADNIAEFRRRIDNPRITMNYTGVDVAPRSYAALTGGVNPSISFRGLNERGEWDFYFSNEYAGSPGPMYEFYADGNLVYVMERACGNPLGLPYLPPPLPNPENWTVSGGAKVRPLTGASTPDWAGLPTGGTINGTVGQEYEWQIWLRNNGPTDMTTGVSYVGVRSGYSDAAWNNDWARGNFPIVNDQSARNGAGGYIYGSWFSPGGSQFTRYRIQDADVGRTICQRMAAYPRGSSDATWYNSANACVYIPYNYALQPLMDVTPSISQSPSQAFSVTTTVNKGATSTRSQPTDWRIIRLVYAPGTNPTALTGGSGNASPCDYFAGELACNANWRSYPNTVFEASSTSKPPENDSFGSDFKAGTHICFATAVSRPTQNGNPLWAYSDLKCVTAAKSPRTQIWGGDVRVGNSHVTLSGSINNDAIIRTSRTVGPLGTKGSWGEYALFAPTGGTIDSASAGAFSGKDGMPTGQSRTRLSFANTVDLPGRWATARQTADLVDSLYSRPQTGSHNGAAYPIETAHDAVSVIQLRPSGAEIKGTLDSNVQTLILRSEGTVTIKEDILIGSRPFSQASQAPQIILVARNIVIDPGVKRVDAWLIARPVMAGSTIVDGAVSTCGPIQPTRYYDGLYVDGPCDQNRLIINGPVIARELQLRRTAGEDVTGDSKESSEVVNMRADAYLWGAGQMSSTGRIDTIFTKELPPRF